MKKFTGVCIVLTLLFVTGIVSAKNEFDFALTLDYTGKYIWRGQNIDDDPVFQPGFSAGYKGFTASLWGNLELTNINGNSGDFSEIDYTLDYSGTVAGIEGLDYSSGFIFYDFPGTKTNDTTEVYGGLTFALPLTPSITAYHDLDEADGTYVSFAIEQGFDKIVLPWPDLSAGMDISASTGWGSGSYNNYYWGTDQSKLNELAFSVEFPMEIASWTLAPNLHYVTLLSDDIRSTDAYGTDSDFFFAGLTLTRRF